MAAWFRVAEELFEVVDRRAKQVTDDLLVGQNTAPDLGVLGRVLATSPLTKGRSTSGKHLTDPFVSPTQANGNGNDISRSRSLEIPNQYLDRLDTGVSSKEDVDSAHSNSNKDVLPCFEKTSPKQSMSKDSKASASQNFTSITTESTNIVNGAKDGYEVTDIVGEGSHGISNGTLNGNGGLIDSVGGNSEQERQPGDVEPVKCRLTTENDLVSVDLMAENSNQESFLIKSTERPSEDRAEVLEKVADALSQVSAHQESIDDGKQKEFPKLEEQLDEAQGLMKTAVASGQSKEARLARVCAGLSSRLQEYKIENAQLEALVQKEKAEKALLEIQTKQMQLGLTSARATTSSVETEMSAALASKNAEIEVLLNSLDSIKRQAAISEGNLASLQANMEVMARSRDMTESGMIQTLREELEAAENRGEEESLSHNATRKAAAQREAELEERVADVTAALTRMQRTVDERTQKSSDLEHKLSTLEIDCANLNQELQDMEAKLRREQKRPPEEAAQTIQLQAWRDDADRARQAQREAERMLSAIEVENQKLRVELTGLKREGDHYSTQAHLELEKRFQELTELLYSKQTQLEAMASEKAAAVFQLEKELSKSREAQAEAERHKRGRHSITFWDDENEMKPLESLGLHQRHLVGPSIRKAAKLLDSGAVTAGRFLWRRPLARLGVLFYLVFVHVFLLYLLHRLQEQVDSSMSSREEMEAAAAAGLVKLGMQR